MARWTRVEEELRDCRRGQNGEALIVEPVERLLYVRVDPTRTPPRPRTRQLRLLWPRERSMRVLRRMHPAAGRRAATVVCSREHRLTKPVRVQQQPFRLLGARTRCRRASMRRPSRRFRRSCGIFDRYPSNFGDVCRQDAAAPVGSACRRASWPGSGVVDLRVGGDGDLDWWLIGDMPLTLVGRHGRFARACPCSVSPVSDRRGVGPWRAGDRDAPPRSAPTATSTRSLTTKTHLVRVLINNTGTPGP